ncbi:helix-turn-helix transcriptional regulator [Lactiplantibacillus carotarum]|uniref:helix-turn-helix transcriptional regulator n=1 Tax=Lactiplantibacillus carotarum TaxID=2993456 RepID=UPI002478F73D
MHFKPKDSNEIRISISYLGKSQRAFADSIHVSHGYLSQILNGKKTASPTVAMKISNGIGKTIDSVFLPC